MTKTVWRTLGVLFYGLVVTTGLLLAFSSWAYDDPFITYRYAEHLAQGVGFVYNPGVRTLSTTTPLFTLLLAALQGLGLATPLLANFIGALSLAVGAILLWDLGRTWQEPWVGWAALALYPTFPLLVSTLGSETPLYLALCLGAFALYARDRLALAALVAALAVLARPDGVLVALLLAGHFLWIRQRPVSWAALALFSLPLLAWFGFAWTYFGSPLPVTLAAKRQQGAMAASTGFLQGFVDLGSLYLSRAVYLLEAVLALLGLGPLFRSARQWLLFLAWPVLYFLGFTALGVSNYFWYYAPLIPGLLVLVGLGLTQINHWLKRAAPATGSRSLVGGVLLLVLAGLQLLNLNAFRQLADPRYAAYRAAGEWLQENIPSDAWVGTLEVGIIGYYARNPMVDFAGLIQPQVAAQLGPQSTYEDAARWAVETLTPQYLVLHSGMMAALEAGSVRESCTAVHTVPGLPFGYRHDLVIYNCR